MTIVDITTHRGHAKSQYASRPPLPGEKVGIIVAPPRAATCQWLGPKKRGCKRKASRGHYCGQHAQVMYATTTRSMRR